MKACKTLPEGYREIYSVDMDGDKKVALKINGLALLIAAAMAAVMVPLVPVSTLFTDTSGELSVIKPIVLMAGLIAYIILHEAVHGVAMKCCGCGRVRFGFKGSYAFAMTDDYIPRRPYLIIALAPIVVWGIVLAVVNFLVPRDWVWVVYLIQISNISGAAGDLFISFKLRKLPSDLLVKDEGVSMTVYSARE